MGTFGYSILIVSILGIALAQQISTSSSTSTPKHSTSSPKQSTTSPEILDATIGGKQGNPGAKIYVSNKVLDAISEDALANVSDSIKAMKLPDVAFPIAGGVLKIKSARITDVKIPNFENALSPPKSVLSSLHGASVKSVGEWQFQPLGGVRASTSKGGQFRTIISNAQLNSTNRLDSSNGKPVVSVIKCDADLGKIRVEIDGHGENNSTVIDDCNNFLCQRIKSFFSEPFCNMFRGYVRNVINKKLSTFKNRVNLGSSGNQLVLDYGLLSNEPKVSDKFIEAGLEGEVLSRGTYAAPFHAANLSSLFENKNRMSSFQLSDYAFNTLFYHAHNQQFPFSAFDSLSNDSKSVLQLNCSSGQQPRFVAHQRNQPKPKPKPTPSPPTARIADSKCLGSILDNVTDGQYPADSMGNLVFKSQRPLQVILNQQPQKSQFFTTGGMIQIYDSAINYRNLILRADIKSLRGEIIPKLNGSNVTGVVSISELELSQPSGASIQSRHRSLSESALAKLSQFAKPILVEMFNAFLQQYAQFPVNLIDEYECVQPDLRWSSRTMQVDCDYRLVPHASRKNH